MFELKGKIVLITGGLGGIGLEILKALLHKDVHGIVVLDLQSKEILKNANLDNSERVLLIPTDITNPLQTEEAFKKTTQSFGNIDVVINAAAIIDVVADWQKCIDINLMGTIRVMLLAIDKYMKEGVIVNIASTFGLEPGYTLPTYTATKHAIIGYSRSMALKMDVEKKNINILTICPGATRTKLLELGMSKFDAESKQKWIIQEPSYVANALVTLVSTAKNGAVWVVSQGETYEVDIPDHRALKVK